MESSKVAIVGVGGIASSAILEQINVIVAIAVGVATFIYIITKLMYLIKNKGEAK